MENMAAPSSTRRPPEDEDSHRHHDRRSPGYHYENKNRPDNHAYGYGMLEMENTAAPSSTRRPTEDDDSHCHHDRQLAGYHCAAVRSHLRVIQMVGATQLPLSPSDTPPVLKSNARRKRKQANHKRNVKACKSIVGDAQKAPVQGATADEYDTLSDDARRRLGRVIASKRSQESTDDQAKENVPTGNIEIEQSSGNLVNKTTSTNELKMYMQKQREILEDLNDERYRKLNPAGGCEGGGDGVIEYVAKETSNSNIVSEFGLDAQEHGLGNQGDVFPVDFCGNNDIRCPTEDDDKM
jgi:hypothetical protein